MEVLLEIRYAATTMRKLLVPEPFPGAGDRI
jgi:hypothetical protein